MGTGRLTDDGGTIVGEALAELDESNGEEFGGNLVGNTAESRQLLGRGRGEVLVEQITIYLGGGGGARMPSIGSIFLGGDDDGVFALVLRLGTKLRAHNGVGEGITSRHCVSLVSFL